MSYPVPERLVLPAEPYEVTGYTFGQHVRRHVFLWATHLGDDVVVPSGTKVSAIGDGEVVWAENRVGSAEKPNWGGLVMVGHSHRETGDAFLSVYGHLCDVAVTVGDAVVRKQTLGLVADSLTPENGWWEIAHLHFAIYVGPWQNRVLPGYKRVEERRTKVKWWRSPREFIEKYNSSGQ